MLYKGQPLFKKREIGYEGQKAVTAAVDKVEVKGREDCSLSPARERARRELEDFKSRRSEEVARNGQAGTVWEGVVQGQGSHFFHLKKRGEPVENWLQKLTLQNPGPGPFALIPICSFQIPTGFPLAKNASAFS